MASPFSSPRKSSKESKNPYSNRGLDKFSALLSELDEKRQSIYEKKINSDGPPLVRFMFTNSGECVPVLIKTKRAGKKKDAQDHFKVKIETKTEEEIEIKKTKSETVEKQSCVLKKNLKKISRPNHFLPMTVILVLIFLMLFERVVSILCTCIVWYLVPIVKEQTRNRGSKKKKLNMENQTVLKEKFTHPTAAPDKIR